MSNLASYTQIGLEPNADSIRQQFATTHGWENQYRLIIQLGKQLPVLPSEWQQE
ncbi:MAG: SufE family protein, partial [Aeromonas sp.]